MTSPFVKDSLEIEFRDREAVKEACKKLGISYQRFVTAYMVAIVTKQGLRLTTKEKGKFILLSRRK